MMFSVTCCWRRHVRGGIQQRSDTACIQYQEKEQGRRDKHIHGWDLLTLHFLHQAWIHQRSRINFDQRWWCYQIIHFQNPKKEILIPCCLRVFSENKFQIGTSMYVVHFVKMLLAFLLQSTDSLLFDVSSRWRRHACVCSGFFFICIRVAVSYHKSKY